MSVKSIHKFLNLLIVLALTIYGVFFYINHSNFVRLDSTKVQQNDFSSVDVDKVVNKYMKQTTAQMLIDQANSKKEQDLALQQSTRLNKSVKPMISDIPLELQIHKNSNLTALPQILVPNQELDKKEYARQFIENARLGGYHVELADDLSVISVTPIRKPSQIDQIEILPSN